MEIKYFLNQDEVQTAVEIFQDAFASKFSPIIQDEQVECWLYQTMLNTQEGIYAFSQDGDLLGLLNYRPSSSNFSLKSFYTIRKKLGFKRSIKLFLFILGGATEPTQNEMFLDFIAVSRNARSLGVGSRLLTEFEQIAAKKHVSTIALDVIETNPRAKQLYEQFGYSTSKTVSIKPLHKWLGLNFTYYHHMEKKLTPIEKA